MKRWLRRLLIVLGVVAVILVLRMTVFKPAPVPVTVHVIEKGRVESTVVNSRAGTVLSRLEADLSPGLSGLVAELKARKGDRVRRGQTLLRIDNDEYTAQVRLAERALEAARKSEAEACLRADQAERELARNRRMAEQGFLSDDGLDKFQTTRDVAVAGCAAAKEMTKQADASLATSRATLAKTIMTAPFDGMLSDVTTEVGEWISPSAPGLPIPAVMHLISPESLYVSAPIDEVDVGKIRRGLPVRITIDAFPGRDFEGVLSWTSPVVDAKESQNRTQNVEATFTGDVSGEGVLPGLSADVEVILTARTDVLRIPTYAILEGNQVLVVKGDRLEAVTVETGLRNWQFTEITGGLSEGDRVVVSLDRSEVKAGARVKVTGDAPS